MADQDSNEINLPLALSSSTAPWWDLHHHAIHPTLSTSSGNNTGASVVNLWDTQNKLNSSNKAFNHSNLAADEPSHLFVVTPSSNYIIREPETDNNSQLWSQFLPGMFEPSACGEYLRKLDRNHQGKWAEINGEQYLNSDANEFFTNNLDKKFINSNAGYNGDSNLIEISDHHRSLKMLSSSNLVSSWSIAPPNQTQTMQLTVPHPRNNNNPSVDQYDLQPDITSDQTMQSEVYQPQLFEMGPASIFEWENSCLNQRRQENDQCRESEPVPSVPATLCPMASFNESGYRPICGDRRPREIIMPSQHGYRPSGIDPLNKSFSRFSSKPLPSSVSLLDARKQLGTLSKSSGSVGGQGTFINERRKKRSGEAFQSSGSLKKPKRDSSGSNPSTASSAAKMTTSRTPQGKVEAEKLSALHQIVSPHGKTDTATILQEAIGFIRHHQENVQMLSNPYLKSSVNKLQEAWGNLDRKGEKKRVLDLKSKGLCLVPISGIPQEIKEDNSGLDYWPSYRGYLYR